MTTFTKLNRNHDIQTLKSETFDLLIIGGGITGAGIALQAAASKLKTALVEMQDFSEGTSSRSTKLVHGGIRYLKQFDIDVVADTVTERAVIKQIAPHIPQPSKMLLPLYEEEGSTFNPLKLRVSMDLYDSLANVPANSEFKNRMLTKEEVIELQPNIDQKHLIGGGLYLDYTNNDSRLVIENIKQAVDDGAVAISRTKVIGYLYNDDQIAGVEVQDLLTNETYEIKSKIVINATGVWSDTLRAFDQADEMPAQMRPTKGIHISVDKSKLSVNQPVYIDSGENDGRMIFVLPRGNKTYFGTTDTDYQGDLENPTVDREDVDYLLRIINRRFKDVHIELSDIESSWAGLRPLIESNSSSDYNGGNAGRLSDQSFNQLVNLFDQFRQNKIDRQEIEDSLLNLTSNLSERENNPSAISRGSKLSMSPSGLITIAGGKITDYRKMAYGAMKLIIEQLQDKFQLNFNLINSEIYPISGGHFAKDVENEIYKLSRLAYKFGVPNKEALWLANLYGSNMDKVMEGMEEANKFASVIDLPISIILSTIYSLKYEMTFTLSDYFARRTNLLLFETEKLDHMIESVAEIFKHYLQLTDDEIQNQINDFKTLLSYSKLENIK